MQFLFDLDGYQGASGTWTILVPADSAGDLPERVFGMHLQAEGSAYPIGHLNARHLGSDACEYDVLTIKDMLTPAEQAQLEKQARGFLDYESDAFARSRGRHASTS